MFTLEYRRKHHTAFTLIELIVVLLVMSICMAATIPLLNNRATEVITTAKALAYDLQHAKNVAVMSHASVWATFDTELNEYSLTDANSSPITHPMTKKDYTVAIPDATGVTMTVNLGSDDEVHFNPLGEPDATGTVAFGHSSLEFLMTIRVSAETGRITVSRVNIEQ